MHHMNREDFKDLPDYKVESIVGEFYEDVTAKKKGKAGRSHNRRELTGWWCSH